jgi:hypothetical protein
MLRDCDRLYFGHRVGRGSALSAFGALVSGVMPWAFLDRYMRGDFDDTLLRLKARA